MVFLQGTITMHSTGVGVSREERVKQSQRRDAVVVDYLTYVPIDNAVQKLTMWKMQGAEIVYLKISDDLLRQRTAQRNAAFADAKNMQAQIEKEITSSDIPVIEFSVG